MSRITKTVSEATEIGCRLSSRLLLVSRENVNRNCTLCERRPTKCPTRARVLEARHDVRVRRDAPIEPPIGLWAMRRVTDPPTRSPSRWCHRNTHQGPMMRFPFAIVRDRGPHESTVGAQGIREPARTWGSQPCRGRPVDRRRFPAPGWFFPLLRALAGPTLLRRVASHR